MYANETWFKAKRNGDGQEFNVNDMRDSQMGIEVVGHTGDSGGFYNRFTGFQGKKKRHLQVRLNPKHQEIKAFLDKIQAEMLDATEMTHYGDNDEERAFHHGRLASLTEAMKWIKQLTEFEGNE